MGDSLSTRGQDDDEFRNACHTRRGDLPLPSATVKWFTNDAREAAYIARRADRAVDAGLKKANAKLKQAQQYEFLAEQAKKKTRKYARQIIIQAHPEIQKLLQQCEDIAVSKGLGNLTDLRHLCRNKPIVKKLPSGGTKTIRVTDILPETKPSAPAINAFFPHAEATKIAGAAFSSKGVLPCTNWGLRVMSNPEKPLRTSSRISDSASGSAEKHQDLPIRVRLECPKNPKCGDDFSPKQVSAVTPITHTLDMSQTNTSMKSALDESTRAIGSNAQPCYEGRHSKDFFIPKSQFDAVAHVSSAHLRLKNLMAVCCHVPSFVDKLTDVPISDGGVHMHYL